MTHVVHAGDIVFDKRVLYQVHTNTKLSDCAQLLKEKNILSVPVWDATKKQYVGIIDCFDMMRFTALGFFEEKLFHDDLFEKFSFAVETAGDLLSQSPRSRKIVVLEATDTLQIVLKMFKETGTHRCLVRVQRALEPQQPNFRIMSQSDVVRYLERNNLIPPSIAKKRIEELERASPLGSPVVSCRDIDIAAEAFLKMVDLNVNAVAVVNEQNQLVTNLSASDLRGISQDNIKYVKQPVLQFLKGMSDDGRFVHPITCTTRDLLENIIPQVITAKVHRIWVTNSAKEPLGVVTLTDILNALI